MRRTHTSRALVRRASQTALDKRPPFMESRTHRSNAARPDGPGTGRADLCVLDQRIRLALGGRGNVPLVPGSTDHCTEMEAHAHADQI
jgi:hypothetical protein